MCYRGDILLSNHTECQSGSSAKQAVECFCMTGRPVATSVTLQNGLCLIPFDPACTGAGTLEAKLHSWVAPQQLEMGAEDPHIFLQILIL